MNSSIFKIKRFIWLSAVFVVRIIFAPRNFKVPILKGLYFNFFGGFTSDQVALYNLTKESKHEYLSEFDWYKSRRINYPNSYMLNNKLIFVNLIKDLINTPETIFKKENNKILLDNDKEVDINKAMDILKEVKSVYFKPISVGKGIGIFRIDYKNNNFYIDFEKRSEKEIKETFEVKDNYFLSNRIKQALYLDNIYDKTSNTIRLITASDEKGVKILFAVQRIGTKDTIPVDNGSRGGLVAKINLKTGKLSAAKSIHNNNEYIKHPDSNNKIEGVQIPNWDSIKKQMIEVTEKLPQFKFIAWDLLPTDKGVFVIEANSSSGVNIIQVFGGQRHKELGNFYRKQKVIK